MRTMIMGTVYDTDRADVVLYRAWMTYHPNISDGSPTCMHERGVYKGRNGGLFAYKRDDVGYGCDRAYRIHCEIEVLDGPLMALVWCEHEGGFDVADVERHFGEVMEEA